VGLICSFDRTSSRALLLGHELKNFMMMSWLLIGFSSSEELILFVFDVRDASGLWLLVVVLTLLDSKVITIRAYVMAINK
jgi:hypothetical protein